MPSLLTRISRPRIISQHDRFHDQIDELNRAICSNASHEYIHLLVTETIDYLAWHFMTEESLMQDIRYPSFKLDIHKVEHSEALIAFRELLSDLTINKRNSKKFYEYIIDWIHEHEMNEDHELSVFLDKYLKPNKPG